MQSLNSIDSHKNELINLSKEYRDSNVIITTNRDIVIKDNPNDLNDKVYTIYYANGNIYHGKANVDRQCQYKPVNDGDNNNAILIFKSGKSKFGNDIQDYDVNESEEINEKIEIEKPIMAKIKKLIKQRKNILLKYKNIDFIDKQLSAEEKINAINEGIQNELEQGYIQYYHEFVGDTLHFNTNCANTADSMMFATNPCLKYLLTKSDIKPRINIEIEVEEEKKEENHKEHENSKEHADANPAILGLRFEDVNLPAGSDNKKKTYKYYDIPEDPKDVPNPDPTNGALSLLSACINTLKAFWEEADKIVEKEINEEKTINEQFANYSDVTKAKTPDEQGRYKDKLVNYLALLQYYSSAFKESFGQIGKNHLELLDYLMQAYGLSSNYRKNGGAENHNNGPVKMREFLENINDDRNKSFIFNYSFPLVGSGHSVYVYRKNNMFYVYDPYSESHENNGFLDSIGHFFAKEKNLKHYFTLGYYNKVQSWRKGFTREEFMNKYSAEINDRNLVFYEINDKVSPSTFKNDIENAVHAIDKENLNRSFNAQEIRQHAAIGRSILTEKYRNIINWNIVPDNCIPKINNNDAEKEIYGSFFTNSFNNAKLSDIDKIKKIISKEWDDANKQAFFEAFRNNPEAFFEIFLKEPIPVEILQDTILDLERIDGRELFSLFKEQVHKRNISIARFGDYCIAFDVKEYKKSDSETKDTINKKNKNKLEKLLNFKSNKDLIINNILSCTHGRGVYHNELDNIFFEKKDYNNLTFLHSNSPLFGTIQQGFNSIEEKEEKKEKVKRHHIDYENELLLQYMRQPIKNKKLFQFQKFESSVKKGENASNLINLAIDCVKNLPKDRKIHKGDKTNVIVYGLCYGLPHAISLLKNISERKDAEIEAVLRSTPKFSITPLINKKNLLKILNDIKNKKNIRLSWTKFDNFFHSSKNTFSLIEKTKHMGFKESFLASKNSFNPMNKTFEYKTPYLVNERMCSDKNLGSKKSYNIYFDQNDDVSNIGFSNDENKLDNKQNHISRTKKTTTLYINGEKISKDDRKLILTVNKRTLLNYNFIKNNFSFFKGEGEKEENFTFSLDKNILTVERRNTGNDSKKKYILHLKGDLNGDLDKIKVVNGALEKEKKNEEAKEEGGKSGEEVKKEEETQKFVKTTKEQNDDILKIFKECLEQKRKYWKFFKKFGNGFTLDEYNENPQKFAWIYDYLYNGIDIDDNTEKKIDSTNIKITTTNRQKNTSSDDNEKKIRIHKKNKKTSIEERENLLLSSSNSSLIFDKYSQLLPSVNNDSTNAQARINAQAIKTPANAMQTKNNPTTTTKAKHATAKTAINKNNTSFDKQSIIDIATFPPPETKTIQETNNATNQPINNTSVVGDVVAWSAPIGSATVATLGFTKVINMNTEMCIAFTVIAVIATAIAIANQTKTSNNKTINNNSTYEYKNINKNYPQNNMNSLNENKEMSV